MQYFALLNDLPDRKIPFYQQGYPNGKLAQKAATAFFSVALMNFQILPPCPPLFFRPRLINVNEIDRPTTAYRHRILGICFKNGEIHLND